MAEEDPVKALFTRSRQQTADLAKLYLRDKESTGRLVTSVRSRAMLTVWIGGVLLVGFILFTLANTIGKSLLGLEKNLEQHREYIEAPMPRTGSRGGDADEGANDAQQNLEVWPERIPSH